MTGLSTAARIDEARLALELGDGRVSMAADTTTDVRVETPDHTPLSAREPHLALRVADDDIHVTLKLDGEDVDALADAIYHAREGEPATDGGRVVDLAEVYGEAGEGDG